MRKQIDGGELWILRHEWNAIFIEPNSLLKPLYPYKYIPMELLTYVNFDCYIKNNVLSAKLQVQGREWRQTKYFVRALRHYIYLLLLVSYRYANQIFYRLANSSL